MLNNRLRFSIHHNRTYQPSPVLRAFFIISGATLVAISLQFFLIENHVIDGGIVGVSLLISHIYGINVGLALFLLNLPFLYIGYYYLGKRFLFLSFFAISILSMESYFFEPFQALTNNPLIVILFGGFLLGLGVGTIIRYGGCLDGTEVLAILLSERTAFSVGQYVMMMNFFIFGSSVLIYGFEEAVYSMITFFVAYQTIDLLLY